MDTVIGVGATNSDDALAIFSSRGPGPNAAGFSAIKPDISAPGAQVSSASSGGDRLYATLSGTSMACPAVAGVVALLLGANPNLTYNQIYEAITSTAFTGVGAPLGGQQTCDNIAYDNFPSNHYGYGRIDAAAAINAVRV
jgi:subtilisin family serine protease